MNSAMKTSAPGRPGKAGLLLALLAVGALHVTAGAVKASPLPITSGNTKDFYTTSGSAANPTYTPAGQYTAPTPNANNTLGSAIETVVVNNTSYKVTETVIKDGIYDDFVFSVKANGPINTVTLMGFNLSSANVFYTSATPTGSGMGVVNSADLGPGYLDFELTKAYGGSINPAAAGTYVFGIQVANVQGLTTNGSVSIFTGTGFNGKDGLIVPTPEPSSIAIGSLMALCSAGIYGFRRWRGATAIAAPAV